MSADHSRDGREIAGETHVAATVVPGALFIILIGIFIAGVSFLPYNIDRNLMDRGTRTEATVVDFKEYKGGRGSDQKATTFSYTVPDGATYIVEEKKASKGSEFPDMGSKHPVYYNPDRPQKAVVEGWEKKFGAGGVAGGIAVLLGTGLILAERFGPKKVADASHANGSEK